MRVGHYYWLSLYSTLVHQQASAPAGRGVFNGRPFIKVGSKHCNNSRNEFVNLWTAQLMAEPYCGEPYPRQTIAENEADLLSSHPPSRLHSIRGHADGEIMQDQPWTLVAGRLVGLQELALAQLLRPSPSRPGC